MLLEKLIPLKDLTGNDDKHRDGVLDQDALMEVANQIFDILHVFLVEVGLEVVDQLSLLQFLVCGLEFVLNPDVNEVQQLDSHQLCKNDFLNTVKCRNLDARNLENAKIRNTQKNADVCLFSQTECQNPDYLKHFAD